ncbi:MAG: HD-GYP domain-containing protein [Methylococcales bacterium]|nr:HD-GYP domain-containing protein [Methylococcales bacterium]
MDDKHNIFLASSVEPMQIDVHELKVGMYVCKLDKPWLESGFLFQGFELKNQADIDAVRNECKFVFIDVEKQNIALNHPQKETAYLTTNTLERKRPPLPKTSFIQEIDRAAYTYGKTSDLVRSFMEDVQMGKAINAAVAKKVVAECVNSIIHTPDALLWMTQLKHRDMYTAQHSMNVCILAIALGKHLNLAETELNNLGLCGMMHDMGKMKVPLEILNKPEKLEPKELKIMQSHSMWGGKLLIASKDMYAGAIDVARSHHERLDGKGYPSGLNDAQITPYSRIVTIVDMYDAISSDRVYQKGRSHLEALKIMTDMCGTQLDTRLTYSFIECIGIYPPGSIVELNSGEIAVVIEVNPHHKLKPKILLLLDEDKQRRPLHLIDLFLEDGMEVGKRTIKNIVRADTYNINLEEYYNLGLIGKGLLSTGA